MSMWSNKHSDREIPDLLRDIKALIEKYGGQIVIDLTKLQAIDVELAADVTALTTTVQTEAVALQAAIDKLAAINSTDPVVQAAIDTEVANLTTTAANLKSATVSVQGLPTAPTPPAAA